MGSKVKSEMKKWKSEKTRTTKSALFAEVIFDKGILFRSITEKRKKKKKKTSLSNYEHKNDKKLFGFQVKNP